VTGVLGVAAGARMQVPGDVRRLHCEFTSVALGPGPDPWTAVRVLAGVLGDAPMAALIGEWCGGDAVLATDPLIVVDGADHSVWAQQPTVRGAGTDAVGGGWFGWIDARGATTAAFYDNVLRLHDGRWYFDALSTAERAEHLAARATGLRTLLRRQPAACDIALAPLGGADRDTHLAAVERAVSWIRAGEIYQANICTRLHARLDGSPAQLFAQVGAALSPRFGAYVNHGGRGVAAMSPELFLRRRDRSVSTAPIKGTRPRSDPDGASRLRHSVKDVAENVMIVDLMRNDLGRVAQTGSVQATALLSVEPHPGVWHLVSTVTGRLRDGVDDAALLAAAFPPGSVTGAPKLRALDAIAELEGQARGAYTGAVGFAGPVRGLELAVAIRTFEFDGDRVQLGVGGGITADSVPMLEWRECLHKAAPLLAAAATGYAAEVNSEPEPFATLRAGGLLETVLVIDGNAVRLDEHLARLDRSLRELYGIGLADDVAQRARAVAAACGPGRFALRICSEPDARTTVTVSAAAARPSSSDLRIVARPPGLWRHKWADRVVFAAAEQAADGQAADGQAADGQAADGQAVDRSPGATRPAPLFVAQDGTVLETSRGNIFLLSPDGSLITPPLRDDLLPGVTRQAVLDLAHDAGRPVALRGCTLAELRTSAAFWTSSLSGAVPVASVDGVPLPRRDAEVAALAAALLMS
jgi:para-aminobenzoate synthetase/4-amino-4-deoxychorismate lyase